MSNLLVIITGRIYDDLIDYHLKFFELNYKLLKKKFDKVELRLEIWDNINSQIKEKLKNLENLNINYHDSKLYSKIGYIKTFQLNNDIINQINIKDFDYILRIRTDILINRLIFDFDERMYFSLKWARGISDNFGFCLSEKYKKIWGELNLKELEFKGPEIYLRDKLKENKIKLRELNLKIILIKSMKEKRRPGIRIWDKTNKLIYLYQPKIIDDMIFS